MSKIPKIIHYCWFGGKELPELAKFCIASWEKYLPDYKIMRWDESNFDLNSNDYVREAYENKKWAFITDYVRLYALKNYGGVYMDTDVEVLKDITSFLDLKAFSGFDNEKQIPTGIMASEKDGRWVNELLKDYDNKHFVNPDGSFDMTTNVVLITNTTKRLYPFVEKNSYQDFGDVVFFPKDYFCPKNHEDGKVYLTDNSYTIHHFNGSWLDDKTKKKRKIYQFITRLFGTKFSGFIKRIYRIFYKNPNE